MSECIEFIAPLDTYSIDHFGDGVTAMQALDSYTDEIKVYRKNIQVFTTQYTQTTKHTEHKRYHDLVVYYDTPSGNEVRLF